MANINELNITNFTATGSNTPFPRYTFNLEVKYTDDAGVSHTYGPTLRTFPTDLSGMPPEVIKRYALEMITANVLVTLGAAQWSDYA